MTADLPPALAASTARRMWEHFFAISAIPRPSGGEGPVREHLLGLGARAGWESEQDAVGNVVFRVPGRGLPGPLEPLIIQSHMDMVCEKDPAADHDFTSDPLALRVDGDWVQATGTTLGSDNGIGMALALAVAESELPRRLPLELLFTVDEETGLTGAMRLDAAILRGRRLINLDSEEEGVFIVGCAGGGDVTARFSRLAGPPCPAGPAVRCRIGGLRGGHSGINIHEGRANAIVAAAGVLERLRGAVPGCRLLAFRGGTKKNVIPREAEFLLAGVSRAEAEKAGAAVLEGLAPGEPGVSFAVAVEPSPERRPLPWETVGFLSGLPNGVIAMDPLLEDLVHTSSNLGVVESDGDGARVLVSVRSASDTRRDEVCAEVASRARRLGAEAVTGGGYPGWPPNPEADVVHRLVGAYRGLFRGPTKVRGIHAGLEAGIIGAKIGTGELVSLGPNIENAHSPGERLSISSSERVYRLLETFVSSPP